MCGRTREAGAGHPRCRAEARVHGAEPGGRAHNGGARDRGRVLCVFVCSCHVVLFVSRAALSSRGCILVPAAGAGAPPLQQTARRALAAIAVIRTAAGAGMPALLAAVPAPAAPAGGGGGGGRVGGWDASALITISFRIVGTGATHVIS